MTTAQNINFSKKGFTLIELLVVISIIAILAVMGYATYRGINSKSFDARRQADLKALGDVLEVNKNSSTGFYTQISDTLFVNSKVPVDPGTRSYCITYTTVAGTTPPASLPSTWASGCPAAGTNNDFGTTGGNTGWTNIASGLPTGNVTAWRVCATLDNPSNVICRSSAQ